MQLVLPIFVIFFGKLAFPVFSYTIYDCGGIMRSSNNFISYKLHGSIAKNERCVWIIQVDSAQTYNLNVERYGSQSGREVTGACFSIGDDGKTEFWQYGNLDATGSLTLDTCHVLVLTLYSGENPGQSQGFKMEIRAIFGSSSNVNANSRYWVIPSNEGILAHPPSGTYNNNEITIFVYQLRNNRYDSKRANVVTYMKKSLESSGCLDHLLVYKLRIDKNRWRSWENSRKKGFDYICGDSPYKMWASDDLIMVVFRSDASVTNSGFTLIHADLAL